MDADSILKEYRNGDSETRLSLFLDYRDFRDEFMGIETASDRSIKEKTHCGKEKTWYCPILSIFAN